jgi:hypothetical protein
VRQLASPPVRESRYDIEFGKLHPTNNKVRTPVVVDRRAHREELERFEACVVRWPLADDRATWKSAVGADGYGRFWVRRGGQQIMVRAEGFADRHGGEFAAIRAPHR